MVVDPPKGRWIYKLSLTHWDRRRFSGGETLILERPNGRPTLFRPQVVPIVGYKVVDPGFNDLLVFDSRLAYGVEPLQGVMDPYDSRIVLYGHIREGGPVARGGLTREDVLRTLETGRNNLKLRLAKYRIGCSGVLSLRLWITPEGRAQKIVVLTNHFVIEELNVTPVGGTTDHRTTLRFAVPQKTGE
jgi:hypothetical protein